MLNGVSIVELTLVVIALEYLSLVLV